MTISGPRAEEHDLGAMPLGSADARLDALLADGCCPLRLWALASAAFDHGAGFYVAVGASGRADNLPRLALERRAFVVATHLDSGVTRIVRAQAETGRLPRLPPMPTFDRRDGQLSSRRGAQVVGLEAWPAGASWPPGRYALVAVAGDRASERVEIAVGEAVVDAAPGAVDPEGLRVWPPPDPTGGLPHYHPLQHSPGVPAAPGIALVVEPDGSTGRAVVYGSFRAHLRRRWTAAHGAVVPITLVLAGSEDAACVARTLRLPSFDPVNRTHPPDTVTGCFAVDLLELAPLAGPQTYFLHAFSCDASVGGVPVTVVARQAALASGGGA